MVFESDPSVRLKAALEKATAELLAARNERGFWEGELSSSALSTATAVTALAVAGRESQIPNFQSAIDSGLRWLAEHQNDDGGWGDTTKSLSNISTTTLCWAAFGAAMADEDFPVTVKRAKDWLARNSVPPASRRAGATDDTSSVTQVDAGEPGGTPGARFADQLARAIIARYGKDRTFSVPILTMCALAGRLGKGREAWRHVIPLPFELAACPHQLFAALRLPVVSYALPALIAIGQARHVHAPSRNPIARLIRMATRGMTLRKLTEIQPPNGGFLEATPLTSFVTMSLAASGQADHIVTRRGLKFLLQSQRPDGSWPIDTNLSTWCTTLAIDALPSSQLSTLNAQLTQWLLGQQYRTEHPYTHAAPGGWAWTDLPGGVPDADDTAGALLALHKLLPRSRRGHETLEKAESEKRKTETDQSLVTSTATRRNEMMRAAEAGVRWLLDLQNSDGGIPTFCRGWGALPFDRSSPDITAHAIRAWLTWQSHLDTPLRGRTERALKKALIYLVKHQREDHAFVPLWFGNQFARNEENCTYGTSRVILAILQWDRIRGRSDRPWEWWTQVHLGVVIVATRWLLEAQHFNGAWSGGIAKNPSVEETALAVQSLAGVLQCESLFEERERDLNRGQLEEAMRKGVGWLMAKVESGAWREPAPIGLYFAKLWYFERLYPLIFTAGALRAAAELLDEKEKSGGQGPPL